MEFQKEGQLEFPNVTSAVVGIMAILAATAFPRLMLMWGLPATDEGVYAYYAQLAHATLVAGNGLPTSGTLALYPMLLSWIFELGGNHMILLRLADLIMALGAVRPPDSGRLIPAAAHSRSDRVWGASGVAAKSRPDCRRTSACMSGKPPSLRAGGSASAWLPSPVGGSGRNWPINPKAILVSVFMVTHSK